MQAACLCHKVDTCKAIGISKFLYSFDGQQQLQSRWRVPSARLDVECLCYQQAPGKNSPALCKIQNLFDCIHAGILQAECMPSLQNIACQILFCTPAYMSQGIVVNLQTLLGINPGNDWRSIIAFTSAHVTKLSICSA